MKVNTAYINPNETFCCSLKGVKDVFKEFDDVEIGFAYPEKNYRPDSISYPIRRPQKVKGTIVCKALMQEHSWEKREGEYIWHEHVDVKRIYIYFYVVKKEEYSEELKREFEETILPKLKNWYEKYRGDNGYGQYQFFVEFYEGEFYTYENLCA